MFKTRKEVDQIKKKYPVGSIVEMEYMEDIQAIPPGTKGTITVIDDIGQLHMQWETGSSLAIIPGEDRFKVLHKPIQILVVPPGEKPHVEQICETLELLQEKVGGRIEYVNIAEDTVLICNEEGKLMGLEPNRRLGNDILVGTFLIAGYNGSDYLVPLTDEQIETYKERFMEIENIQQEEVTAMTGFKFYNM